MIALSKVKKEQKQRLANYIYGTCKDLYALACAPIQHHITTGNIKYCTCVLINLRYKYNIQNSACIRK